MKLQYQNPIATVIPVSVSDVIRTSDLTVDNFLDGSTLIFG